MDGLIVGWLDDRMVGWLDGWIVGWLDDRMVIFLAGWMERLFEVWVVWLVEKRWLKE